MSILNLPVSIADGVSVGIRLELALFPFFRVLIQEGVVTCHKNYPANRPRKAVIIKFGIIRFVINVFILSTLYQEKFFGGYSKNENSKNYVNIPSCGIICSRTRRQV